MSPTRRRRTVLRLTVLPTTAALALAGVAAAGTAGSAFGSTGRTTLTGTHPAWATSSARVAASVSDSTQRDVRVYLAPQGGQAALQAAVRAVSTPGSATYRHYLTAAQYTARFAPTADAVAQVRGWLTGAGLQVAGVDAQNRFVEVVGTTAAVRRAFAVDYAAYRHNGSVDTAPTADASAPSAVGADILGVVGLDSAVVSLKPAAASPGFRNARPCSQGYGDIVASHRADYATPLPKFDGSYRPYAVCGYIPSQFRAAYGVSSPSLTGAGAAVGIIDAYASPTILKDANTYATNTGGAKFAPGQFSQNLPKYFNSFNGCAPSSWYGEESLDVEAVHGMAPGAAVRYYAGENCFLGLVDAADRAVQENRVQVVSNSYGNLGETGVSDGYIRAQEQPFLQGAMEGIAFLFSSGDYGDDVAVTGLRQADYPASDPYVTAVGGTSTAIADSGAMLFQTGWGTHKYSLSSDGKSWVPVGFVYGAGGGFSTLFNRPAYQDGYVPAGNPAGRAVPDIAMDADPTTGMLVGQTQAFPDGTYYDQYRIGGTSLASPLAAGMEALAVANAGGKGFGFLNPSLYTSSGQAGITDVLPVHTGDGNVRPDYINGVDATSGVKYSVRTFNQDSSLVTAPGWDDVTGLGTLNSTFVTSGK